MKARAVTFDFGQVLASFDPVLLREKLRERGFDGDPEAFEAALPAAWDAYGKALRSGGHGARAWKTFLRTVLEESGAREAARDDLLDFLFADQRERNLWQRPVPGMIDVARDLRRSGVPIAILSNSEGRLAELVKKLGWEDDFPVVSDSGVLGVEKPDPAIFRITADAMGVCVESIVHIGDSWAADVEGALGAGAKAIWFPARPPRPLPEGVRAATDVSGVRRALVEIGFPIDA